MSKLHASDLRSRFAALPRVVRLAVPLVLGIVAALGHEGWMSGFWPVTVALAIAFLIVPVRVIAAGWFGWWLGLGYLAMTWRWLIEPFLIDIERHGWMAPFALFFLAGSMAFYWAVAFGLARWLAGRGAAVMLWLPVTLTLAELARGHWFTGFPWGLPSYVLIGGVGDIWFALVGPYGTTLLLIGVAGGTAYALHRGWTLVWPALIGVLFATLGLNLMMPATPAHTDQTVRLVQPNAAQHLKWDRDWMQVFFDRALAQTGAGDPPDVVIWPETSVPSLLENADPLIAAMSRAARGAPVVAGLQRREGERYYNSAILIEGPQTVESIVDKAHLVPWGEYLPLENWLTPIGLDALVDQVGGFTKGTGGGMMQVDGLGLIRILICYEGIFPEEIQQNGPRPDVLVIITNDAWFGQNAGPRQHLVQAQARAIEQGLPVLRAANTGISAVIDARGRIVQSLPLNEAGHMDARVPAALPLTLYARFGDWPLLVLLVACILLGGVRRRPNVVDAKPAQR